MVEFHLGQRLAHLQRHRRTRGVVVGALVGAAAGRREGVGDVEVTADDDVLVRVDVAPIVADHVELVRVVGIAGHLDVIEAEVPHLQGHGFGRGLVGRATFVVDAAGSCGRTPAVVVLAGEHVDGLVSALAVHEHQRRGVDEGQVNPDHLLTGRHGEVRARRLAVEHEEGDAGRARRVGQGTDAVRAGVVLKEHRRAGRHGVVHVAGDRQGVVHAALDLERPVGAVHALDAQGWRDLDGLLRRKAAREGRHQHEDDQHERTQVHARMWLHDMLEAIVEGCRWARPELNWRSSPCEGDVITPRPRALQPSGAWTLV